QGHPHPVLRPPQRRRDVAHGVLPRGPRAPAHPARGHRLRLLRGPHDLRPHRREGLDLQGRGARHACRAPGPGCCSRRCAGSRWRRRCRRSSRPWRRASEPRHPHRPSGPHRRARRGCCSRGDRGCARRGRPDHRTGGL
ncbi:MAG: SSU ribosomal protein S3p (S3e), partial [uncultured Acidimicrobiales bacterium]